MPRPSVPCGTTAGTVAMPVLAVDAVLRTYGVEYLGRNKRTNDEVYYCNAGDTYSTTVLFVGPHLRVGCWGDLIERGTVATAPDY
jgi:hypothetical protein